MTKRIPISLVLLSLLWCAASIAAKEADSEPTTLPSPAEFDPARYVGKWFEAARLPTAMQPDGSLASAEYALGEEAGSITVKNTAYDANGALLGSVEGKAILVAGEPKGRLRVGFGPEVPSEPNYCVLWVNPKYRFAVVGSPDRKSLWILARQVPVNEKRLKRFASIAKKAGYDTAKLVVATWPQDLKDDPGQGTPATPKLAGNWVLSIDGPDGEKVELPLILEMDGVKLTGKIGRGDDGWLPLKDSELDGNSFAFSVERDRPGGGSMTYRLAGTIADDKLSGTAKTELNGEPVSRDWDAVRGKQEEEKNVAGIAGTWTLHLTGSRWPECRTPNGIGGRWENLERQSRPRRRALDESRKW